MFTVDDNSTLRFKLGMDAIPKFLGFIPGSARPQWELNGVVFTTSSFFYSEKEKVLVLDIVKIGTVEVVTESKPKTYADLSSETLLKCVGQERNKIVEICITVGLNIFEDALVVCRASSVWDFVLKHNKQGKSFGEIIAYLNKMLGVKDRDEIMCIGMFKRAYDSNSTVEVVSSP